MITFHQQYNLEGQQNLKNFADSLKKILEPSDPLLIGTVEGVIIPNKNPLSGLSEGLNLPKPIFGSFFIELVGSDFTRTTGVKNVIKSGWNKFYGEIQNVEADETYKIQKPIQISVNLLHHVLDSKEKYKALFTETQWDIFEKYINGPDVVKKKSKLVNMQKTPQIVATKERFNVDRSLLNQEITTFKSMVGDIQIGKKQFESQIYNQLRILNKDKSERIRNLSQGSNSIMSFFESIGEDDLSYARELIVCLKSRSNTRMKQSEDEKLYGNINKYLSSAHDYCENLLNTRRKSIQEQ